MVANMLLSLLCVLSVHFSSVSSHKIVTYWGQNGVYGSLRDRQYWEKPLIEFCQNYKYDTIVLSFLHVFFDTANKDNMPAMNFAYHCETGVSDEYPTLLRCPKIEEGIKECQKRGKSILMSLGGASGAAGFRDDAQGKLFAYRVYHLLLGGKKLQNIRPFGTAILNGVDLDIEGGPPTGYTAFVKELRRLEGSGSQKITISAAPQCPYPDAIQGPSPGHFLGDVPELIDELYVQFYNNWCYVGSPREFWGSFKQWIAYSTRTNGPKVFIGVPARNGAGGGYVEPNVLAGIYAKAKSEPRLGGIMFWDASFDQNNVIGGKHFSDHVADFMGKGGTTPTQQPVTLPPGKTEKPKKTEKPIATEGPKTTQKPKPTAGPHTVPPSESCEGLEDGFYPLKDCTKFIRCIGGKIYHYHCPAGLYFNPKINMCDWPAHVDCKMPSY